MIKIKVTAPWGGQVNAEYYSRFFADPIANTGAWV